MTTMQLTNGYNKKEKLTFRHPKDVAELVAHCESNSHIWFQSNDGTARRAKVNGSVRTWKRNAQRVEVPVKYGLREYGTFTASDIERVLIPA